MSATLLARHLSAAHGDRTLFSGLDLVVAPGDVVGLVGANGAGKTTLLRLLAGLSAAEQGSVTLSPASATVGYLPQEPERRPGESIAALLARRTGVAAAQAALDVASHALSTGEPIDGVPADDAYVARARALAGTRWRRSGRAGPGGGGRRGARRRSRPLPVTSLSGGQAARASLASLLLARYDVFLLDEPTNDLDLAGPGPARAVRRTGCGRGWWWSATTASSSPAP